MNFSQPPAARTRRDRLGAPGAGSGAARSRPLYPGVRWGREGVVKALLLSDRGCSGPQGSARWGLWPAAGGALPGAGGTLQGVR